MANDKVRMAGRLGLFAGLVGLELWLGHGLAIRPSIRGYVDVKTFAVSTAQHAIVRKVDVALGQAVTAGQIVAELDTGTLETDLAQKLAERKRLVAGIASGKDPAATPDALRVVDIELEALADKRDNLRLKAPADGIVESIDARPGDAVGAASPVATIVASDTRRVVACIPEARLGDVQLGSVATVEATSGASSGAAGARATGAVESLTPAVAPLPERCQLPTQKGHELGRLAVVLLDQPAALLPGESQLVAFSGDKRALPATPGVGATSGAAWAPAPIDLPPEIVAASRFEASGLVWVPNLDRYLVVSDETGTGDSVKPPWLFTMSRRGVVDPEPITIEGLKDLDDVESIAAGDSGALWIAASQSVSQKGKRPRAREAISRLVPTATGYKLDAKTHLASLLAADPARATALEVPDLDALDIEAMAYRDGALYLGLKAPVDAQRRALIWKIAAPDKLLANDLAGANITIAARVVLAAEVDGKPVTGGFADLMFLDATHLLATATASGVSAKGQSGALYALTLGAAPEATTATKLRSFEGLRPEGIAIGPDPHRLAVVFDRGKDAPMWTELDVPSPPADL